MDNLAKRILTLRPAMNPAKDFIVICDEEGERLAAWDERFGPIPTSEELMAADFSKPTPEEKDRLDDVEILKAAAKDETVPRWARALMRRVLKGGV